MRRVLALLVAAVAAMITMTAAPAAALADDGYRWTWTFCDSASGGNGTPNDGWIQTGDGVHAKIKNCKVIWQKDIYEGLYWQAVQFEMADAMQDGAAALAQVKNAAGVKGTCSATGRSYCADGDTTWTAYNIYLDGRTAWLATSLYWGSSSDGNADGSVVRVTSNAPSGF